jgi:hypothetical protein
MSLLELVNRGWLVVSCPLSLVKLLLPITSSLFPLPLIINIYTSILQNFTDSGIELGYEVYIIRFMAHLLLDVKSTSFNHPRVIRTQKL